MKKMYIHPEVEIILVDLEFIMVSDIPQGNPEEDGVADAKKLGFFNMSYDVWEEESPFEDYDVTLFEE